MLRPAFHPRKGVLVAETVVAQLKGRNLVVLAENIEVEEIVAKPASLRFTVALWVVHLLHESPLQVSAL
jgi:hypothetical protein